MQILLLAFISVATAAGLAVAWTTINRNENFMSGSFCAVVSGKEQVRHYYDYPGGRGYIVVDCETDSHVWEGGLDKRSSLDSLQQAIFASALTGKEPAIVIFDRDGEIGKYEHRISVAAKAAGVHFEIHQQKK